MLTRLKAETRANIPATTACIYFPENLSHFAFYVIKNMFKELFEICVYVEVQIHDSQASNVSWVHTYFFVPAYDDIFLYVC